MLHWVRSVLARSSPPPDAERSERAAHLAAAELEVERQTVKIRRIRREAQIAELRLRRR